MRGLKSRITRHLAEQGGWVSRPDLTAAMGASVVALDDELADLVMTEQVEWSDTAQGYRLRGTPVARLALRRLVRRQRTEPAAHTEVVGRVAAQAQKYLLGVAQERTDTGLVMYELAMPMPAQPEAALQVQLRLASVLAKGPIFSKPEVRT